LLDNGGYLGYYFLFERCYLRFGLWLWIAHNNKVKSLVLSLRRSDI
jgi:hypothetical protein